MRPGRLTPENHLLHVNNTAGSSGFNEAGAINPGKPMQSLEPADPAAKLQ